MRLGAVLIPFSAERSERGLADRARTYASCGYHSLWAANSIGRGVFQGDPFIALAVAASVTKDIELGTGIVQLPLYHPVDVAQRALSLMDVCGDRFVLGVGAGSNAIDFGALDRDYGARIRTMNENLKAVRSLLGSGTWGDVSLRPLPEHHAPPIYYGTWGNDIERAAAEFDGWIASAMFRKAEELDTRLRRYREAGGERAIVTTVLVGPDTDLGRLRSRLDEYDGYGFDDVVIMFMPGAPHPEKVRALVG